jgi:hypothetical protein
MPTHPSSLEWHKEKVFIIGRASPEPSRRHVETVCTGGITESGEVFRLYQITWRYLEEEKRYKQFDIAKDPRTDAKKATR